ncbi:MAG: DUF4168 domain-containing protein [Desulfonatronovibrio sp. MSAO_Bac4]|nr:MAG: DUF4168 domain-containing protein [Desulfonatronovibrio sp. MSAO_Bac4]
MTFAKQIRIAVSVIFFAFLLTLGTNAMAQDSYQGQDMMQQPAAPIEVSDADLNKAASAYVEIAEIRESFEETLAGVSDPEKAHSLQEEAMEEMVEAVQNNGLDVQAYNEIMEAAQADEELGNQFLTLLDQKQ